MTDSTLNYISYIVYSRITGHLPEDVCIDRCGPHRLRSQRWLKAEPHRQEHATDQPGTVPSSRRV